MKYNYYSKLICPFCNQSLELAWLKDNFGLLNCSCCEYPIIYNIIYLIKNDSLTNKKIIGLIKKKKYDMAIYKALSAQRFTHKYLTFLFYLVSVYVAKINPMLLIYVLSLVGPSKSWFKYLLERKNKTDIKFATNEVLRNNRKNSLIIDVGCGIGSLWDMLQHKLKNKESVRYIGLEKSFLSLLIMRLIYGLDSPLLICCDVEFGLPIRNALATEIFFLDCFSWIFSKKRLISESSKVLRRGGSLYLINLRADKNECESWWGYGITPDEIKRLILPGFRRIYLYDSYHVKSSSKNIDPYCYSAVAIKT